jgi:ribonuclease HI
MVMRDHSRQALAARFMTHPYVSDPAIAEAFAARCGIRQCRELGIQRVIFEGDSLEIVSALQREAGWHQKYSSLVDEARILLASFQYSEIVFVRRDSREGNQSAHGLARMYVSHLLTHTWFDTWPASLFDFFFLNGLACAKH